MRIAHVTDFYLPRLGGIELHVSDLARRQVGLGHDVTVVTANPSGRTHPPADGPTVLRVTDDLRHPRPLHPWAPFRAAAAVLGGDFDVVHVHLGLVTPLGFWVALRAARAGIPTVLTVHSLWNGTYWIFRALDAIAGFSRQPLRWTAVSEAAAVPVRRITRDRAAVTVLPNGIDPQTWRVAPLPRDPDEVVVVAVMRLATRKRPTHLLRMLRQARAQVPAEVRIRAVIVGDGRRAAGLRRYVDRHGMRSWVELPGRQTRDQIRELYRRADVFVAPADLESFGIAALEARCAGIPVVAKAVTGIAEFVVDGQHGLLVADDAAMTAAVARLCSDAELRAALAHEARNATSQVTWTRTLDLTESAYDEAAALVGRELSESRDVVAS